MFTQFAAIVSNQSPIPVLLIADALLSVRLLKLRSDSSTLLCFLWVLNDLFVCNHQCRKSFMGDNALTDELSELQ